MRWRVYPRYKDASAALLGEIPVHWKTCAIRHCLTSIKDGTHGTFERVLDGVPLLSAKNIGLRGELIVTDDESLISNEDYLEINKNGHLKRGDVLLTIVGTVGRSAIFDHSLSVAFQRSVAMLRPDIRTSSSFLHYFTQSRYFQESLASATKQSAQGGVYLGDLARITGLFPPITEQRAIAAFLDQETGRIYTLISKKERQIELLQEKRAALISHVVTKGLNPNVKMKDSGIEWLGEIPEHWTVCLLKRVAEMAYGMSGELDRTLTQGTPILSLPNVNIDGELILDDVPHADVPEEQRSNLLLKYGDLLFNWRNGSSDHLGKTAFFDLEGDYTHVSFLIRLRFNSDRHDSRYFQRLLSGLRITGFFSSSKAGVNNTFNQSELANLWVMVPPLEEQQSIADFLAKEVSRIKDQIAKIQQSTDRLHEYRSALVSAAVTGRIDVRKEVEK